jgi:hypothetical protein
MTTIPLVKEALKSFIPIGLEEMDNVRLMNRFDTKYLLPVNLLPDFLTPMCKSYQVLEIDRKRYFPYATTYMDTDDYLFFNQHVTGKLERNKVRYRKYEASGSTYLEVKKRTNKNRTVKWRIQNDLTSNRECDDDANRFIKEYVKQKHLILKPVLINSFDRVTLVGTVHGERITIDYNISFSHPDDNQIKFPFLAIIEVKKERVSGRSPVIKILKDLSVHPGGLSKYCLGTSILHDLPRKNMLKPKLLLIGKIEREFNKCSYDETY